MDTEKAPPSSAFVPTQKSFAALLNRDGQCLWFVKKSFDGEVFKSAEVGRLNLVAGYYLVIGLHHGPMMGNDLILTDDCDWTVESKTVVTGTDRELRLIYQFISMPRSE